MVVFKGRHIGLTLTTGCILLLALVLLLTYPTSLSLADPRALFAATVGSDSACTQVKPCGLRTAISVANEGDIIYVAQGAYTGAGDAVITVTKSITLYGGWNGFSSGPVVRNPRDYPSALNGEGKRRGNLY